MENYKTLVVEYNNKQYSMLANPYLFKDVPHYSVREKKEVLKAISKFEETPTELILSLGTLSCEIDASDNLNFIEDFTNVIVFDKASQRCLSGNKIVKDDSKISSEFMVMEAPKIFLDRIISINENVCAYLNSYPKYLIDGLSSYGWTKSIYFRNLFNLCTFNLLELEKLINSNNTKILEANFNKEGFELSDANKLHQIIGLPKFAVQALKDMKMEEYMYELKQLSEIIDGNSLRIFLEFIDNLKLVIKADKAGKYYLETNMRKFINDCSFILDKKRGYKVTELLSYLLRQVVFYRDGFNITFPFAEAGFFKDYIEMNETYGLKYDRYPAKIKRAHNLTAKNIQSLIDTSTEVNDKFEEAVILYSDVEKIIKYVPDAKKPEEFTEYAFITPHSIKALIQEGNDMHHCVGSYVNKIIDKQARVVFMRLASEKNKSLITIDIDEDYNLVEAKKAFNEEVDAEQLKVINKWIKEIKKSLV